MLFGLFQILDVEELHLTPELTRSEHEAFYVIGKDNDERDAIEASGCMSC